MIEAFARKHGVAVTTSFVEREDEQPDGSVILKPNATVNLNCLKHGCCQGVIYGQATIEEALAQVEPRACPRCKPRPGVEL